MKYQTAEVISMETVCMTISYSSMHSLGEIQSSEYECLMAVGLLDIDAPASKILYKS